MICNSLQELRQMVHDQVNAIRTDIATAISNFIRTKNTSVQELSRALGLQETAIDALLNGTRDITLIELITFMVATDKVVHIEDINEAMGNIGRQQGMPFGRMPMNPHGHRMNQRQPYGGRPMPPFGAPYGGRMQPPFGAPVGNQFGAPVGGNPYGGRMQPPFGAPVGGNPMPPVSDNPMPPFGVPVGGEMPIDGGVQPTPMEGVQMPPIQEFEPQQTQTLPDFDEMSRPQLIDFVKRNVVNWQQSIGNLENAKRSDIISFLNTIPTEENGASVTAQPMQNGGSFDYAEIGKNLAQMAQSNPALANVLNDLMRK